MNNLYIVMTSNNTENQKQSRIDVNDSPIMNSDQMQMFLNVRRSRSDQSMLGRLFNQPVDTQRQRPLIISIPNTKTDTLATESMNGFKLFRKIKKEKKKNESDYCKNICGYITKKIIRQLCSPNYLHHVKALCLKHHCQYQQIKTFYLPKIQQVTGPSHIPSLLVADRQNEESIKEVFKQFFQWFIKYRYLRYLLIQGKMSDKKAYIKYKNHMLLSMLNESKNPSPQVIQIKEQQQNSQLIEESQEYSEDEQEISQMQEQKAQNTKQKEKQKEKSKEKEKAGEMNKKKLKQTEISSTKQNTRNKKIKR